VSAQNLFSEERNIHRAAAVASHCHECMRRFHNHPSNHISIL